ncbi:MAG: M48 family metallopeptidase [Cyanobacteria bacterium J06621_8]
MRRTRKQLYWLLALLASTIVILGSLGRVSLAINANHQPTSYSASKEDSKFVAIDFLELIRGAVQYIQVSNISDEQEIEIGKQTNEQVLSEFSLDNSPQVQRYVSSLGQELVGSSNSRNIPFVFQVVRSDQVNAFAAPGGFVYVTTGLLRAADNRAELASVMGHEIAHINEKHGVKSLKQAVAAQGIANTVGVDSKVLAQLAYQLTVDLPRSRSFEFEADSSGLEILQQAGYPGSAFADFLVKLEGGGGTPQFLRTHPTSANRIDAISETVAEQRAATEKGLNATEYRSNLLAYL